MVDELTRTLAALAEPNRLRIVELLREGAKPVNDIAGRLALSQPQASKHLRALRDAGLVEVTPQAQSRLYALRQEPFDQLHTWLEQYRALWSERLDAMDSLIEALSREERDDE